MTHILPLSARSSDALADLARKYRAFFDAEGANHRFSDVCYTASARRAHHECRLAVVAGAADEVQARLDAFLDGTIHADVCSGEARRVPTVAFVFSGQGSQWPGMGRDLLARHSVFAETVAACSESARGYVDWSLIDVVANANAESRLAEIDVLQPVLFSIQVGVARLWQSWGINPAAVVGHSMGEIAAADVAGALSLKDALRIVCIRSRLLKRKRGQGAMGVVGLPADRVSSDLGRYGERVSIAAINSPATTVISGDVDVVADLLDAWQREGASCHRVNVDVASHSAHMDSIAGELRESLHELKSDAARVGIFSTVTGDVCGGEALDADYWFRNLRAPVRLSAAVEKLVAAGHDTLLEISPHPILTTANQETAGCLGARTICLGSLRRDEGGRAMLKSLATLYTLGVRVDWNAVHGHEGRCVPVPSYPWQRQRFVDDDTDDPPAQGGDDALRAPAGRPRSRVVAPATEPWMRIWQTELSARHMPYLLDHRVQGLAVLPAAAYLDVVVRASTETLGTPHTLERVVFSEPLFLSETGAHTVQIVFSNAGSGHAWQFFSQRSADGQQRLWTLHASGHVQVDGPGPPSSDEDPRAPGDILARCVDRIDGPEFYRSLRDAGLDYGAAFRRVEEIWRRDAESIARIDASADAGSRDGLMHPVLLDACFQALFAAGEVGHDRTVHLPISIERLRIYGGSNGSLWGHARIDGGAREETDRVVGDVTLLDERGVRLVEVSALTSSRLDWRAAHSTTPEAEQWTYEVRWERRDAGLLSREQPPREVARDDFWLVLPDGYGTAQQLQSVCARSGQRCEIVDRADDVAELLSGTRECRGIVDCRNLAPAALDAAADDASAAAVRDCDQVVQLISMLAKLGLRQPPPLWLITRRAQATSLADPAAGFAKAPLWGLGRVVMEEHPELRCTLVDLGLPDPDDEAHALFELLRSDNPLGRENQIALRPDGVYVARLARSAQPQITDADQPPMVDVSAPVRVALTRPGDLDSLAWRRFIPSSPGAGEVLIDVHAAGLNFKDVLLATGVLSSSTESVQLGFECTGRIAALGPDVDRFCVGDEVVAFAANSLGSVAITRAEFVAPKPAHLTFEQAAGIPVAFVTAHHALHDLARLRAGERILIHTASGGVGLAAVQFARQTGAEIFATAGSEEKRTFLARLGLRHVMDSRRRDFAAQIMELTGGEGVDVVLNSLSGEFMHDNLSVLRSGGRFLELAKSGRAQRSVVSITNVGDNRAFFAVDLGALLVAQAEVCATALRHVVDQFGHGLLQPLPVESFLPAAAIDACRHMTGTTHIGKVVVSAPDRAAFADACTDRTPMFRGDASYLITGGAGALGQIVARWMVARGARHLVLVGRKNKPEEFARTLDPAAVYISCDVSREDEVASLFTDIERSSPPLRGIVHAAGVLDDSILLHQDRERLERVMSPKIAGAWNLHRASATRTRLDFFALFSSAASVLGSPGQGNYSAANAFLDALASYRRGCRLPALSISWGPWSGGGLAAEGGGLRRAADAGLRVISPRMGPSLLDQVFCWPTPHVAVMAFDMPRWRQARSFRLESPLLSSLHASGGAAIVDGGGISAASIMAAPERDRVPVVQQYVAERVARVLRLPSAKIDTSEPVNRIGLDSLVAVELRNRIERDLGVAVPILRLLSGVSISQLAGYLVEQIEDASMATARPQDSTGQIEQILHQMDSLSDDEARALAADLRHSNVEWDRSR